MSTRRLWLVFKMTTNLPDPHLSTTSTAQYQPYSAYASQQYHQPPRNLWPPVHAVAIPSGCGTPGIPMEAHLGLDGICGMAGFQRGSAMHALHGSSRRAVQPKCGPECPPRGCRTNCSTTSRTPPRRATPRGCCGLPPMVQCAGWGGVKSAQAMQVAIPNVQGFRSHTRQNPQRDRAPSGHT